MGTIIMEIEFLPSHPNLQVQDLTFTSLTDLVIQDIYNALLSQDFENTTEEFEKSEYLIMVNEIKQKGLDKIIEKQDEQYSYIFQVFDKKNGIRIVHSPKKISSLSLICKAYINNSQNGKQNSVPRNIHHMEMKSDINDDISTVIEELSNMQIDKKKKSKKKSKSVDQQNGKIKMQKSEPEPEPEPEP